MMIFLEDTDVARSIPTRIDSYLVSLLESSLMTYSILSYVGDLSCKPTPAPACREALSTLRIHQRFIRVCVLLGKSANICPFNAKRGLY